MKKILTSILSVMIIIGLTTINIVAQEITISTPDEFVQNIEDETYEIITLGADIDLTGKYSQNETINIANKTLNLNGHKLTLRHMAPIFDGANYIIRNGTIESTNSHYAIFVGDSIGADNAVLEDLNCIGGFNIYNSTNVTLRNCTAVAKGYYAIWCDEGAFVNVEGGSYSNTTDVYNNSDGEAVLSSPSVIGLASGQESGKFIASLNIDGAEMIVNSGDLVLDPETRPTPIIDNSSCNISELFDYTIDGSAEASYSKNGSTGYAVGNTINEKAKELDGNGTIEILSGSVDLTGLPEGVKVTNNGEGTVTVNGVDVAKGTEVESKPATYVIVEGDNQTWTGSGELSIKGSGEYKDFDHVEVDGSVVDSSNYSKTEGSTIITFNGAYLNTLSNGQHTAVLYWTDGGSAKATFSINVNTSASDSDHTSRPTKPSSDNKPEKVYDPYDTNKDGVVTCEEKYGEDWYWNEKTKACMVKGYSAIIVDTATR